MGDVQRPSGFLVSEDNALSVLKALALAGGGTRTSALNKTRIIRQTPNGVEEIPISLKKILYAKGVGCGPSERRHISYREVRAKLRHIARRTQPWG